MYLISEFTKLFGLVGWAQDSDPAKPINSTLTTSRSGLKYNSVHSLLSLDNIRSTWNYPITIPEWLAATAYVVGNKAKVGARKFISIQNGTNKPPLTEPTFWTEYDDFSVWLAEETQIGINNTLQDFIRSKQLDGKQLLESKTLFDGTGNIFKTNQNTHQLVGFELNLARAKGITAKIEKVGFQATQIGTFKLYLFHSSVYEPLETIEIEITKANSINWIALTDVFLRYQSDDTDAGGSYYLCYLEDALTGLTIEKTYDFRYPCLSCGGGLNLISKYLRVSPFKVNQNHADSLWDKDDMIYFYTNNFGMNLQLSLHCDLTEMIIANEDQFKDLIQIGVAKHILRKIAFNFNAQINRNQRNIPELATMLYEIDGNPEGRKTGIGLTYDNALNAIRVDSRGYSPLCAPCNKDGVNYTSIK